MDSLTLAISSLSIPIVTYASTLLDDPFSYIIIVALLLMFFEPRWEKRIKVVFVIAVALMLSIGIKEIAKVPRPCDLGFPSKVACPTDYSFPSNHAAIAFALMLAFINKPTFPIYLAFALFVAFSRVYLGVHTIDDVLAGLVIAPIAYQTVEIVWRKKR